ncbi:MAG: hypothetical protein H6Q90_3874 [Deltaproteobacteria bacterium]|nr:hypothetical protein [Deltaproteobacteria bacterium]
MNRCAFLLLGATVACGANARPQGSPDATPTGDGMTLTDGGVCHDVVDVVFVLDVSSSMDFVLNKLDAEIDAVVVAANTLAPDAHFGLIAFADNYNVDSTGAMGKVHTDATTLKAAFKNYKNNFTQPNRNPGDGPTGLTLQNPICEENALDSLHAAAAEFPWRDNATRVVIAVTDDTFLERPDNYGDRDGDGQENHTDFPREGDYPAAWTLGETVTALKDQRARVFSFTRLTAPGPFDLTRCSTGRRLPWEAISNGWSTPYNGAPPIPMATQGRNLDLDLVKAGQLSLSTTINELVVDSYCHPPIL